MYSRTDETNYHFHMFVSNKTTEAVCRCMSSDSYVTITETWHIEMSDSKTYARGLPD